MPLLWPTSPSPARALSADELRRLALALHPYAHGRGGIVAVVMSMKGSLPRVAGVAFGETELDDIVGRLHDRGWDPADFDVYGPYTLAPTPFSDEILPTAHTPDTQCAAPDLVNLTSTSRDRPTIGDIKSVTLAVEWAKSSGNHGVDRYTWSRPVDVVFLTRGGREAFSYPRYQAIFGVEYVDAMRAELGDRAQRPSA